MEKLSLKPDFRISFFAPMPTPTPIEVLIGNVEKSLDSKDGILNTSGDLKELASEIKKMSYVEYQQQSAAILGRLSVLRAQLPKAGLESAPKGTHEALVALRYELDKSGATQYDRKGERTLLGSGEALVKGYGVVEKDLSGAINKKITEQFGVTSDRGKSIAEELSKWSVRGAAVASASVVAAGAVWLGYQALKGLKWIATEASTFTQTLTGLTAAAGTAFFFLPQELREKMGDYAAKYLPESWSDKLAGGEGRKKERENNQKLLQEQSAQTDKGVQDLEAAQKSGQGTPSMAKGVIEQIDRELATIKKLSPDQQKLLESRVTEITSKKTSLSQTPEVQAIQKNEQDKKAAELKKLEEEVVSAIQSLPVNQDLFTGNTERTISGMRVRFQTGAIYVNDYRLHIQACKILKKAGVFDEATTTWTDVTLSNMKKAGDNLVAQATAKFLGIETKSTATFTPVQLVEALDRFRQNQLVFEERQIGADKKATDIRLKYTLTKEK